MVALGTTEQEQKLKIPDISCFVLRLIDLFFADNILTLLFMKKQHTAGNEVIE